jgi:hypothetical protein
MQFEKDPNYGPYRILVVIRDPVHLIVSHYFYDYDGHEGGTKYENATEGLIYQLTKSKKYVDVGKANELVRRNSPEWVKMGCLEDFMESEDAFYDLWETAFTFWQLPIPPAHLRSQFTDLNPLSPRASKSVKDHGTFQDRETLSLSYAHQVLQLEITYRSEIKSSLFSSLADLSSRLRCWDWKENKRGIRDKWILQKPVL